MAMVVVASSLTLGTLTMTPTEVNAVPGPITQINCSTLDARNGDSLPECRQQVDRSEGSFDDCIGSSTSGNCRTSQNVAVSNNIQQANIHQLINTWIDCDRTDSFCLARTLNTGTQNIDLQTYRTVSTNPSSPTSQISADVDQHLTQQIATDGQDRFRSSNSMTQTFEADAIPSATATASNIATIDAFGDEPVRMYATQNNDECDDVGQGGGTLGVNGCVNQGTQTYDLEANGRSEIDLASTQGQGLELSQYNNCDDDDDSPLTIDCFNRSTQTVKLTAGSPATTTGGSPPNNDAFIDFDILGNSETVQSNDCDFGTYDCENRAETLVNAFATGGSEMFIDNVDQDITQDNTCDNLVNTITGTNFGCQNLGQVFLEADSSNTPGGASEPGIITVTNGEQTLNQDNDCRTADCKNEALLYVGLGSDLPVTSTTTDTTGDDPVDGTLTVDYSQIVDQQNRCVGNTACENEVEVYFLAYANDDATVTAISDQLVTQINECGQNYNQICFNTAELINDVFGSGTSTVDSTVLQDVYQYCGPTSGTTCLNSNNVWIEADATGSSNLQYTTTQDINPNDPDGTSYIKYTAPPSGSYQFTQTTINPNQGPPVVPITNPGPVP